MVKSALNLLSWCSDGSKATLPELILDKFDSKSEYHTQWKTACENAKSVLQKLEKSNTYHCSGRAVGKSVSGAVSLTGPDLDGHDANVLDIEPLKLADFDLSTLQLG